MGAQERRQAVLPFARALLSLATSGELPEAAMNWLRQGCLGREPFVRGGMGDLADLWTAVHRLDAGAARAALAVVQADRSPEGKAAEESRLAAMRAENAAQRAAWSAEEAILRREAEEAKRNDARREVERRAQMRHDWKEK